mgnify:CR=1 FL=1
MAYTPINKSTDYFNTKLYTGNYSTNAITGVGHQPDFTWIKTRTTNGENHYLFDAIRGVTKYIHCDTTAAQSSNATTLTTFGSDGFTVGANNSVNKSGEPLVSWNWKANGQGSSNTDGTINTTYTSASTTSGFSISTFTGTGSNATVGHGLGVAPKMVIIKSITAGEDWTVYHSALGGTKYVILNSTGAQGTNVGAFNNTAPTNSVFTVGTFGATNGNSQTLVAYSFAEIKGFSKIGKFAGNGNANGGFIYCGFKPSFFMIKEIQSASDWHISFNNVAAQQNPIKGLLYPNTAGTDSNTASVDFNSNGVKIRTSGGGQNESNKDYLYMALAEAPLVGSNNVPATAR